jgi:hypothetical protein
VRAGRNWASSSAGVPAKTDRFALANLTRRTRQARRVIEPGQLGRLDHLSERQLALIEEALLRLLMSMHRHHVVDLAQEDSLIQDEEIP